MRKLEELVALCIVGIGVDWLLGESWDLLIFVGLPVCFIGGATVGWLYRNNRL